MATGKITKRSVESIATPSPGKRNHLWDETLKGFGLMVTDKGKRSYLVQYRIGGRGSPTRRVTIGGHGNPWTAETARAYAAEILEQVRRKVDPFEARKKQREIEKTEKAATALKVARDQKLLFSTVAEAFIKAARSDGLDYQKKKTLKAWRDIESVIQRDLSPALSNRTLNDISADDLNDLLEEVGERGPSASRHAFNAASAVFRYATKKHRRLFPPSASPIPDVVRPAAADAREHYLNDNELRIVWNAAGRLGWPFGAIYQMLILTGQRLREVAHAPWTEFDLSKRHWLIAGGRTKNQRPNLVQLSDTALDIVSGLPRSASDGDFLFTTTGNSGVSGFSRAKSRIDAIAAKQATKEGVTIRPWRVHDLRRTLSVGCQAMGVKLEVIEEVINHKSGSRSGIVGTYQVYDFQPEKRAAWEAWEKRIMAIANGAEVPGNVIQMGGARV